MKDFAKDINWLPLWLFAVAWSFLYFIANITDTVSKQAASPAKEICVVDKPLHKEYPITFSSFDSPQVFVHCRSGEDKGKHTSKYFLTGTFVRLYAATAIVTYFFHYQHTYFCRYLFILYCVLLI